MTDGEECRDLNRIKEQREKIVSPDGLMSILKHWLFNDNKLVRRPNANANFGREEKFYRMNSLLYDSSEIPF